MATALYAQFKLASGEIVKTNTKAPNDESENWLRIIKFNHAVVAPVSKDDGIKTGERRHDPMILESALEKSAPYFLNAVCQGKKMDKDHQFSEMVLRSYRGDEQHYFTTALAGAKCVSVRPIMLNYKNRKFEEHPHLLMFQMRYEAIAWFEVGGKHAASDAWVGGVEGASLKQRAQAIAEAGSL